MPTIAIVGAGPHLGRSVAHVFGSNGYRAALIARRRDTLDDMVEHPERHGVTAAGHVADVRGSDALTGPLSAAATALLLAGAAAVFLGMRAQERRQHKRDRRRTWLPRQRSASPTEVDLATSQPASE